MRAPSRIAIVLGLAAVSSTAAGQFSTGVHLVEVYATAADARGRLVTDLVADDFVVREDGEVQAVTAFAAGDVSLSVALSIDHSWSMAGERLRMAQSAAHVFLGQLRPTDDAMLIGVSSDVEVLARLSRDRVRQHEVVESLATWGTTRLYDSVIAAVGYLYDTRGRRALVILSDGSDRYSDATAEDALRAVRAAEVLVYPVVVGPTAPAAFSELARLSGGRAFHVEARKLSTIFRDIAHELRHQYLLGYIPRKGISGGGEWRRIEVEVKRTGVHVRAREGYVARQ